MNEHIGAFTVMAGMMAVPSVYTQIGPSLQGLRARKIQDEDGRQELLDTDLLVGGITILVGAVGSWTTRSPVPIIAMLLVFALVSGWHHLVLNSPGTPVHHQITGEA